MEGRTLRLARAIWRNKVEQDVNIKRFDKLAKFVRDVVRPDVEDENGPLQRTKALLSDYALDMRHQDIEDEIPHRLRSGPVILAMGVT